jgi:hypothetical protein
MMKLKLLALLALTTCTIIVIGTGLSKAAWFSEHSNVSTMPIVAQVSPVTEPNATVEAAVNRAAIAYLLGDRQNSPQAPTVRRTVIESNYALSTWAWGEAGGQAVLALADGDWRVLASGGGAVDVATLTALDVPTATAERLIERDQAASQRENKR